MSEPAAVEGRLHGGACGRGPEASPRFSLHWPPALCQIEETDWRVRKISLSSIFYIHFYLSLILFYSVYSNPAPIYHGGKVLLSQTCLLFSQFKPNIPTLQSAPSSILYNQILGCIFAGILNYFPHHPFFPLCCLSAGRASSMTLSGTFLSLTLPSTRQKSQSPCLSHRPLMRSWMPLRSRSHPWGVRSRERGYRIF